MKTVCNRFDFMRDTVLKYWHSDLENSGPTTRKLVEALLMDRLLVCDSTLLRCLAFTGRSILALKIKPSNVAMLHCISFGWLPSTLHCHKETSPPKIIYLPYIKTLLIIKKFQYRESGPTVTHIQPDEARAGQHQLRIDLCFVVPVQPAQIVLLFPSHSL